MAWWGVESMKWEKRFRMLTASGRRGISHGDMDRPQPSEFRGFDVREFYVELVRDLKERGSGSPNFFCFVLKRYRMEKRISSKCYKPLCSHN